MLYVDIVNRETQTSAKKIGESLEREGGSEVLLTKKTQEPRAKKKQT